MNEFISKLQKLSYSERLDFLNKNLTKIFLIDKKNDISNFYEIVSLYNVKDLVSVLDKNILIKISELYPHYEFLFLKYLKDKNPKEFEDSLKTNNNLKEFLLLKGEYLYKDLVFSYDVLIDLIKYTSNNKIDYNKTCLYNIMVCSLKEQKKQKRFLNEDILDFYKIKMFNIFDPLLVTNYIKENNINLTIQDVYNLIMYSEVSLNPKLYETPEFYKTFILSSSIYKMRNNIEKLMNHVDTTYFENILNNIENKILSLYDKDKKIIEYSFNNKIYELFLEEQFKNNKQNKKDIVRKIISMIVIDKLFQDSIRNVCLNIAEIINFSLKNKIITKDKILFYKEILNIFDKSSDEIIDFYNKYKDNYLVTDYYDDILKCREKSYNLLKNSCLKINDIKNKLNHNLSKINNIDIYELDKEPFKMLVTCRKTIPDKESRVPRNCYSLIGNSNMNVFNENNIIYGYLNFDIKNIMHVYEYDSYSENQSINTTNFVNRIRTPDEILSSNHMNEIQILNNYLGNDKYERIWPSYIICFDNLNEQSLNAAKSLNIPIIIIKRNNYNKLSNSNYLENYQEEYTNSNYNENIYQDKIL